jgi:transcriptional regulator with XRE-family HTH domain
MENNNVNHLMTLGDLDPRWIAREREAQGLSQLEVMRRTGLRLHQVRAVERSRSARITHVALVLGVLGIEDGEDLRRRHGPRAEDLKLDGAAIRQVREERGLSQHDVARRAGVNASTLRSIEAGDCDPSSRVVMRVLKALGVANQLPRFLVVREPGDAPQESPRPTSESPPPASEPTDAESPAPPAAASEAPHA